jgi:hypothetical protein
MTQQRTRRDFLRNSAFAATAFGLAAAAGPGTSMASIRECSRSPGYWKNHPDAWPVDELTLGGKTYNKDALLDALHRKPKGNKMVILMRAYIAARLNQASDVDSDCLEHEKFDWIISYNVPEAVDNWLEEKYDGDIEAKVKHWNDMKLSYVDDMELLYLTLDDYNNGRLPCTYKCD